MTPHLTEIRVRYGETDQMGVAHHVNYLQWFEVARTDLLRAQGISYGEVERQGYYLAVVDAHLKYISSARFDELLTVETRLWELGKVRLTFVYAIYGENRELRCTGRTTLASLNKEYKPARLPASLVTMLERYLPARDPARLGK